MPAFDQIPRLTLAHLPTPLEQAPRLSAQLGIELLIKRDDCTGLAGGGNKARKLEYLLADAKRLGADTLVTIGGLQSNHARQTAAAAARFGFACELVLQDVAGTPTADYASNGNMLFNHLLGANIHQLALTDDCQQYAATLITALQRQGKQPYLIPIGGSNAIGSLGYVRCALELAEQLRQLNTVPQQIVVATGSAGTQAGLLAGLMLAGLDIPVLGITVSRPAVQQQQLVLQLLQQVLPLIGLDPDQAQGKVDANGDYYGAGYGIMTPATVNALQQTARAEGILLDPVYTGKAMAGLMDLCQRGIIDQGSRQLFVHTGGSPALAGYASVL
ncbi:MULTISPECIES: D-cysteine desulfhydrase family protein [Rheinheimera]|uniref:D-cysteine desulfhydrase family protein n=1 Tax=Rheinheimera TaxID=67575 RepID=UPI001065E391|nr:D-cysteine desulfhydrase family protein [Rheinheimera aquimaris]